MGDTLIKISEVGIPLGDWDEVCYEVKKFRRETKADKICFERCGYEDFSVVAYQREANDE